MRAETIHLSKNNNLRFRFGIHRITTTKHLCSAVELLNIDEARIISSSENKAHVIYILLMLDCLESNILSVSIALI